MYKKIFSLILIYQNRKNILGRVLQNKIKKLIF